MSNPTLTVGELPESNGAPHDPMETTENLYDSLDPAEVNDISSSSKLQCVLSICCIVGLHLHHNFTSFVGYNYN